nr:hypothetical protein [Pleurocapsa sp. FMAR1]
MRGGRTAFLPTKVCSSSISVISGISSTDGALGSLLAAALTHLIIVLWLTRDTLSMARKPNPLTYILSVVG